MENNKYNIGIVGLGLLGGSLGKAFIQKTPHTIFGCDKDFLIIQKAIETKAIHKELNDKTLPYLDMLIFAINPRMTVEVMPKYIKDLKNGCIVTDVGGVKKQVMECFARLAGKNENLHFIGAHPMAGKEVSGLENSTADLFKNASMLYMPVTSSEKHIGLFKQFFADIGFSSLVKTTHQEHDKIIAYTSQLAHCVSSAYCLHSLAPQHEGFSAGSFKDLTRVAKMNENMWTELFCDNKDNLVAAIDEFIKQLNSFREAIKKGDEENLREIIKTGTKRKESLWKHESHR